MNMFLFWGTLSLLTGCTIVPVGLRHPASHEAYQAPRPLSLSGQMPGNKRELEISSSKCRCLPAVHRGEAPIQANQGPHSSSNPRTFDEAFDVNLNVLGAIRRAYNNSSLILADYQKVIGPKDLILNRRSFIIGATYPSPVDARPFRCLFEAELGQIDQTLKVTSGEGEVHYLNSRENPSAYGIGKLTDAFGVRAFEGYEVPLEEDYIVVTENNRPDRWRYNFELKMTSAPVAGGYRCQLENHDTILLPDQG